MSLEYLQRCGAYQLVCGLRWIPVLGASATQQARTLCKEQSAKAWVVTGRHFSSVGLSATILRPKQVYVSAAVCFATLFPRGVQAAIYTLDDQRYWLIAAHEGTPLRHGDAVFKSLEQAQHRVQQLRRHHTTLVLQPEVQPIQVLLPLLTPNLRFKAQLHAQRSRRWAVVVVVMSLLSLAYWGYVPSVSVAAVEAEPVIDPYEHYWQQQARPASHYVALQALLEHWQLLPLELAAWRLTESVCQIQAQDWLCLHGFKPKEEGATVLDFQAKQSQDWHLVQADLQTIQVQARVGFALAERQWQPGQTVQSQVLAQFQTVRPALQSIKLHEPVRYVDKSMANTGMGFSPIFEHGFSVQAPLRSLTMLLNFGEFFYWEKAALVVNHQVRASLKQSALQVQLQGVTYARD